MVLVGTAMVMMSGTLVYYHCAYRDSSVVSLMADVLIVLLCSLAILGLLFRHMNIAVPVDPLHWQISQDAASSLFASLANTLGAAESVLRVAATGHDKRLFLKVSSPLSPSNHLLLIKPSFLFPLLYVLCARLSSVSICSLSSEELSPALPWLISVSTFSPIIKFMAHFCCFILSNTEYSISYSELVFLRK